MKVIRKAIKLVEDVNDDEDLVVDGGGSVSEIADGIQQQVTAVSDGDATLSDADAQQIAQEVKNVDADIDVGPVAVLPPKKKGRKGYHTQNKITELLDECYETAIDANEDGEQADVNILIVGLPGSGKTATVYDWAESANPKPNLVYINAKNNDLEAFINGYPSKNAEKGKVSQFYSDALDDLDKPNSILFLDEYNRQVKPQIRASLYTLINEHKISGEGEHRTKYFENLLFTIACINPSVNTDPGAAELNDAEQSRFAHTLEFDSTPAAMAEYLRKVYDGKIEDLDPENPKFKTKLERLLRIQDLGLHIVMDDRFAFNTKADLMALANVGGKRYTMLNQRSLTNGLKDVAKGNPDRFRKWLEQTSNYLLKDIRNISKILDDYKTPTFEELCEEHGLDPKTGLPTGKKSASNTSPASTVSDDDDLIIDPNDELDNIFTGSDAGTGSGSQSGGVKITSRGGVLNGFQNDSDDWLD